MKLLLSASLLLLLAAAPTTQPKMLMPFGTATAGNVKVEGVSVYTGRVAYTMADGSKGTSETPGLSMAILVHNSGSKSDIGFSGWTRTGGATLSDDVGNKYGAYGESEGGWPQGSAAANTVIPPGRARGERLVFEMPKQGAKTFTLRLSGKNLIGAGVKVGDTLEIKFSRDLIGEFEPE